LPTAEEEAFRDLVRADWLAQLEEFDTRVQRLDVAVQQAMPVEENPDSPLMGDEIQGSLQLLSVHQGQSRRSVQNLKALLYPLYFLVRWNCTLSIGCRDLWLDRLEKSHCRAPHFSSSGISKWTFEH
jgi:hypothetical protein